ncbi:MAG: serine hydrolase domain-containing protein [Bacteroidia bacterium]
MKEKTTIIVAGIALFFIGVSCIPQTKQASKKQTSETQITEKQIADINQLIDDLSKKDQFSGTVLIAKGNTIIYQKAVGFADQAKNSANTIDTKFNIGSMNKMFTSLSIAQLEEQGKLDYTDKLVKHLPNLPEKTFGNITLEHLLTHTSGAGDIFRMPKFMDIKDTAKTIGAYVNLGINEPLLFVPGEKFQYSNYGYILLGAVIEKLSGMSYFDYVKKNIFAIAGMENTDSYEIDQVHANMAIGYALPPPEPNQKPKSGEEKLTREANTPFMEVKGTSAGGGYSTAIDLHKFSQALLAGKLLALKNVATITKGRIAIPLPPLPPNAKPLPALNLKYGFGFGEFFKNDVRIIGHNGGAPGVDVQMDMYPDLGYTVIVLANYDRTVMPVMNFIEDVITAK